MNRIKQILAPPVFEDEEKTRNARVLHTILSTVFLVMTWAAAAVPLAFARKLETAAIVGLIFLILLGVERLLYTGHIRAASTIVVAILVVMAIGLSLVADGAKSIHIIFSFTAVVLAGLLLDKQSMNLAFTASLLGHLALTWLETSERLPPSLFPTPPVAVWVQVAFNLILITVALGLTRDGIETALDRLRKNELALNQSNAALQSTLVSVEDQVSIRTRELAQAKEAAEAANRQLAAQMWQVAGQAQLSETMRGEQELSTLANNVVRHLCKYLEAQVGLLFLAQDGALEWVGGYAYAPGQRTAKRFKIGEGVVGQAAQDKQPISIKDVPQEHVILASSLGEMVPQHVLAFPLIYAGQVVGVLELGTWAEFGPEQLAFLDKSMESVAIAFHTAQARARIDELLAETQGQAEALKAREEELWAANEELEAQAEQLRAIQAQ